MYIQQINTIYILHIKYLYIQMKFEIIHVSYLILRNLLDSFILFIGKQINIKFLKFLRFIKNIYIYKTYGWKCEKGYSEYAETRGDYFSHPRLWDGITVSDCGYSNLKERKNFFPLEKFNFDRFRKIKKTRTTCDLKLSSKKKNLKKKKKLIINNITVQKNKISAF